MLDTIGAMVAGWSGWEYRDAMLGVFHHTEGVGDCPVMACDLRFSAARSAMIHAAYAHAMELDAAIITRRPRRLFRDPDGAGARVRCRQQRARRGCRSGAGYEIAYRIAVR
jgi:hypothetical protein